jgi:signal transduction histidine kinase
LNYEQLLTATRFIGYGSPIVHSDKVTGGIFVFSALEGMQQSVHNVQKLLFLTGIGAFFLAVGFTFVLSKKLSLPLIRMEQATRTIAKGNLDSHVYIHSNDELGSLGQAINDLALELKQYQDNRNEFFANVSQDLRTPLTYVQGYAHVLNNKLYQNEEEQAHYLSLIAQETHRLTYLIEDLFELSKIEEGKDRLDLEWIDLREVMDNVIEQCRFALKEQGLDLHHRYDATLPLFYGDGLRMERIFTNLLANSIRYTTEGSITVQISQYDNKLLISIEDTGIGIPEDQLPYVFDRFYRVEQSRSRLHGGSGLGLSIVKKLVELHGGTVSIQSKLNIGTRVEVEFIVQASTTGGLEE